MAIAYSLDDILTLALQLPARERLQLIEQVAVSVARDLPTPSQQTAPDEEHWGKALNKLLDSLDTSEWENMDMADPVEWVRNLRQQDTDRFKDYWEDEK